MKDSTVRPDRRAFLLKLTLCVFAVVVVLWGTGAFVGSYLNPLVVEEMERVTSPDGGLDAVWLRSDAGATTEFVDWVVIVPAGSLHSRTEREAVREKAVLVGVYLSDLTLAWEGPELLSIGYTKGYVYRSDSEWKSDDGARVVAIRVSR